MKFDLRYMVFTWVVRNDDLPLGICTVADSPDIPRSLNGPVHSIILVRYTSTGWPMEVSWVG